MPLKGKYNRRETHLDVVASVEHFEVKMQRGLGRPEPEYITWGCN